jgi:hypothetical protein
MKWTYTECKNAHSARMAKAKPEDTLQGHPSESRRMTGDLLRPLL